MNEQMPPLGSDEQERSYLLQEANLLGERIVWYLEQHEKIETLGIISSGAIWAFILSEVWSPAIVYIAWLPTLICLVLAVKSHLFTKTISEAFQYIYDIEDKFKLSPGMGWVHYFRSKSSKFKRKWRYTFWTVLILANIVIRLSVPFEDILHKTLPGSTEMLKSAE